jgi:hypothetical protein
MKDERTDRADAGGAEALDYQRVAVGKPRRRYLIMGILSLVFAFGNCILYYIWAYHWTVVIRFVAGYANRVAFVEVISAGFIVLPVASIISGMIAVKGGFPKRSIATLVLGRIGIVFSSFFLFVVLLMLWLLSGFPAQN